jgi:hypothetical protein
MAIAATVAQLWSYHRRYDHVGLIFLLVALGQQALVGHRASARLAFALVGLSLWLPNRDTDWTGIVPLLAEGIWIFGLITLLCNGEPTNGGETTRASAAHAMSAKEPSQVAVDTV